jgi:uncharacterized membrane protein (GlpM family)
MQWVSNGYGTFFFIHYCYSIAMYFSLLLTLYLFLDTMYYGNAMVRCCRMGFGNGLVGVIYFFL